VTTARAYVATLLDALYRGLGEAAPAMTVDAFVIRAHEASRALGALALDVRDATTQPQPLALAVLTHAQEEDASGALVLYALAMVLGPRLLVTLRDLGEQPENQSDQEFFSRVADVMVREIQAVGSLVATRAPLDTPGWSEAARALVDLLDGAGFSDSLGPREEWLRPSV